MANILLIDDDELVRKTLEFALGSAGHAVHLASDGRDGMKKFSTLHPDLIITDIIMPHQEGIETILELRKLDTLVPILAISGAGGSGHMDFLKAATALGATEVLRKPFSPNALVAAVDACLRRGATRSPGAKASPPRVPNRFSDA